AGSWLPGLSVAGAANGVGDPGEPGAACGEITAARARGLRGDPEGEQPAVLEMEAKLDGLPGERSQVLDVFPRDGLQHLVRPDGDTIGRGVRLQDLAAVIEHFDTKLAPGGVGVDEEVLTAEGDRPG